MKAIRVDEIRRVAPDRYEVLIVFEDGREGGRFTFVMDRGDIDVVESSREFFEFMNQAPGAAKAIYAAVMAVDRARAKIPD